MTRRTNCTFPIVSMLALLLFAAPGFAAGEISQSLHVTDSGIDHRIDLELRGADVAKVLASFAQILHMEAEIDPEIRGEVTIELHNVRPTTALTAVCESVGCLWRIEDGRLKIARDPEAPERSDAASEHAEHPPSEALDERIDMALEDADLRQVLRSFGSIVTSQVEIDPALEGKVTIQLENTPVREALDALCRIHDCVWELTETEEGAVLRITAR